MSASDPSEYVVHKALMSCSAGVVPSQFAVSVRNVNIGGNRYGNTTDNVSGVNINSFVFCTHKGGRCIPQPTRWENYDPSTSISGGYALIADSSIRCKVGGVMKFETSGQIPLTKEEEQALQRERNLQYEKIWVETNRKAVAQPKWLERAGFPVLSPLAAAGRENINGNSAEALGYVGLAIADIVSAGRASAGVKAAKGIARTLPSGAGRVSSRPERGFSFSSAKLKERFQKTNPNGNGLVRACFTGETLVHCASGLKRIDEICAGDQVWSFDENRRREVLCEVLEVYLSETDHLVELTAGNTTVLTTEQHPFMCNSAWVGASDIRKGDRLYLKGEGELPVVHIRNYRCELTEVFNFHVNALRNYFVGSNGILVHNKCETIRPQPRERERLILLPREEQAINQINAQIRRGRSYVNSINNRFDVLNRNPTAETVTERALLIFTRNKLENNIRRLERRFETIWQIIRRRRGL